VIVPFRGFVAWVIYCILDKLPLEYPLLTPFTNPETRIENDTMKTVVFTLAIISSATIVQQATAADDEKLIQGEWDVSRIRTGGKANDPKDVVWSFGSDKVKMKDDEYSYTLDTSANPPKIDFWVMKDGAKVYKMHGIVRASEKAMLVCMNPASTDPTVVAKRPTKMESPINSQTILVTLVRKK
jgi:uncharacterized protein (TIGR03067 family)